MTSKEKRIRKNLKNNFIEYGKKVLKIRPKAGGLEPLILNKAQHYIHERLEEQLRRTGKVRAIILKGRQQGCSTYVGGRFYHKVTHRRGAQTYILTHEQPATANLFKMVSRYHDNNNPLLKPSVSKSNAKELVFDVLDSGYSVGTAGSKSVGRSNTVQYFHGSEVAFWANADEHSKGILQTIPDEPGTEIIFESTANGIGNYFHQLWKAAENGISEYQAIFVPWFWQDEYKKKLPSNFKPTEEEIELKSYYDLSDEQIYWRRIKIVDLSAGGADGLRSFKQEYPMNAAEAFQMSETDGLIGSDVVMQARKSEVNGNGPLIVGVDPSRGGDRFAIIRRQGRKSYKPETYTGSQIDKLGKQVSKIKKILDEENPEMVFIDAGGGADLVDRLHELNYKNVKAIAFGSTPLDEDKYVNKRAEIWGKLKLWLADENLAVQLPDTDEIQADLCASPYERDSHDRIKLMKKELIIKKYGFSPDLGDALALTFAEPIKIKESKKYKPPVGRHWLGS